MIDTQAFWRAVSERDRSADETFVYSVATTGIYCRPSCPSRAARRANVAFHDTPAAAEAAGFRPCLRCSPNGLAPAAARAALIAAACRRLDASETPTPLHALARDAGLSRFHFHRLFREATGITPAAYAAARRRARLQAALPASPTVTDALYDAGYNASSRFYADAPATLGMPPAAYRAGAPGRTIRYACAPCVLGIVLVAATEQGLCAILLGDVAEPLIVDLRRRFPRATIQPANAGFTDTLAAVVALIDRPAAGLTLPLDVAGTVFQHRVWSALQAIPPGQTTTYAALAAAIGAPTASRAVAAACAANPLAVVIPCHRVLRADASPSGYRWGLTRKRSLLEAERAADATPGGTAPPVRCG